MGGLALIARAAGHTVTGCDAGVYPPMSTQLKEQGIDLIEGFDVEQTKLNPDLYIIGNVVSRGNPLMEEILNNNLPYISGPQWLGQYILPNQHVLAISGTHGKTTTSSMLAWVLRYADLNPNFLIGGVAPDLGVSAYYNPNGSNFFVIEADEYDTAFFDKRSKFVHYRPRTLVINNLEYDHADIFPNMHAIQTQFHHLIRTLPCAGKLIHITPSPAIEETLKMGLWTATETFGTNANWQAKDTNHYAHFDVWHQNQNLGSIKWGLTGEHNRNNALAAIAAAHNIGISPKLAIDALSSFVGVKRRMELRGTVNNINVYDDFAHHPSAIELTLQGIRKQVANQRIIAVIEPRSNTMKLGTMAAKLPHALEQADLTYCFGQKTGKHALGWDANKVLAPLGDKASAWHNLDAMVDAIVSSARPNDTIVIMSNGSFGGVHEKILNKLN